MEENGRSEFGAGLVVCLAKFSEHLWGSTPYDEEMLWAIKRWQEMPDDDKEEERAEAKKFPQGDSADFMRKIDIARITGNDDFEKATSRIIELWANAASDHFYDLNREIAPAPLIELADLTLRMGHGFTGETWTLDDMERVRELWQASCLELDKRLGVDPDWGEW